MALIKCPECGHEISNEATSCPNCGKQLGYGADCVLAYRMNAGFAGPIIWMVIIASVFLSILFTGIIDGGDAIIPCSIIGVLGQALVIIPIFELINRIKNNTSKVDVMIYHSETDEFEINHIKDKSFFIKRTSLYRVKCAPKAVIYYYGEDGILIKRKMWYVANHNELRSRVMKYMDKYKVNK